MKPLAIDSLLLDRYEIFGYREGGMGIVYFVEDLRTGRALVAKTVKPQVSRNELEQRFLRELELSIELGEHRNILSPRFVKRIDGQLYLFSDYIDGGKKGTTIHDRLASGAITPADAVSFAYQICLGMEFLGDASGFAHLDLKPSNLLVDRDDVLKIADFGLARALDLFRIRPSSENAGSIPYMAPEHFRGEIVDGRSDVFSFGVIFFEMLTGRHPFGIELRGRSKEEICESFRSFYATKGLGEKLYYGGLPELEQDRRFADTLPPGIETERHREDRDLGVILGGCLDHAPERRFYKFKYIREALEFIYGGQLAQRQARQGEPSTIDDLQRALDFQELGLHGKALNKLNQVLKRDPQNLCAWLAAADSLAQNGQPETASSFIEKAVDLAPTNERLREILVTSGEAHLRGEFHGQIAEFLASYRSKD